jgi:hypothetical protein
MQYDISVGGAIVTCADKDSADKLMACLAEVTLFQEPTVTMVEVNRGPKEPQAQVASVPAKKKGVEVKTVK